MSEHWVFFSPHLDDAVLSCAGTIAGLVTPPTVVTVFAGSPRADEQTPLAQAFAERWGLDGDPLAERRAEDRAALVALGAQPHHLDHRDCIYRLGPDGTAHYPDESWIFRRGHPVQEDVVSAVAMDMLEMIKTAQPAVIAVPLAVGRHVDHRVVRLAADLLIRDGRVDRDAVVYFEDLPYSVNGSHPGWQNEIAADLRATPVVLDPEAWEAKLAAVRTYRSQLLSLWVDEAAMHHELRGRQIASADRPEAVEWFWRGVGA